MEYRSRFSYYLFERMGAVSYNRKGYGFRSNNADDIGIGLDGKIDHHH